MRSPFQFFFPEPRKIWSLLVIGFGLSVPTDLACGQLPGVCMPMVGRADAATHFEKLETMTDAELRAYLQGLGIGQSNASNLPQSSNRTISKGTSLDTQSALSRIPHSVAPKARPSERQASKNLLDPHSAFQAVSSQVDLLNDSFPSNDSIDPLRSMGPDADKEQERDARRADTSTMDSSKDNRGIDPHAEVFTKDAYPSAIQCAKCHQKIYDEWRVSGHAYASISPMFQRFEQLVSDLTRGTVGTFCTRCHAPVATQMNYPREASLLDGPHVFREGITCVACHRVIERYGRINGERRIEPGSLVDPIVGNSGGDGVAAVVSQAEEWKVTPDLNDKRPRQPMHRAAIQFEQLSDSSYCAGCHQVVVQPGIGLEIVYQQYRAGPAYRKGISCQDCHMGAVPGKAMGYECGPAAEVSGKVYRNDRKHSNHIFHGPGYPLAHPGLFPHNEKSLRWTAKEWLEFDWRAGWGQPEFEKNVQSLLSQQSFPKAWQLSQDRRDARKIIEANQQLIAIKRRSATATLTNGMYVEGPFFDQPPTVGRDFRFRYQVHNTSEGHNMPSGSLGAQPQLWLNVVLIDPDGQRLWESGDLDQYGDLRDVQSEDVNSRRLPADLQLFNLQTKFLITNVKGTEREMCLPVNVDIDPLPFFRPGAVPYTVLNHPPFIRMEAHSIPPVDSRTAFYVVPADVLKKPGRYRLTSRLRSRVEPPYFMRFVKSTPDMIRSLNEGIIDVHPYSMEFVVR